MNFVKRLGALLLVFGLVGCAGTEIKSNTARDRQEVVGKRAQLRWDALVKGDLAAAYEYLSPGTRSMVSLDVYKNKIRPGLWQRARVESVSCEVDQCEVNLLVEYSYREMKAAESQVKELWLFDSGDWWYIPKK